MYEHHNKPLASRKIFYTRLLKNFIISLQIIAVSLFIGILGYHYTAGLSWVDSLLNASMILAGMGPVDSMTGTAAKIFASFYALFSGMVFLTTIAVMMAPVLHRFMHKLHLKEEK